MACVKALAESPGLTSIPSTYNFTQNQHDHEAVSEIDPEDSIPVIDFSLLTSSSPDQRSKVIQDLGKACRDWGFFTVINHNVPEKLMEMTMDSCQRFFNLTEEEKREFAGKHVLDPIRCGTSFNASVEKVFFWRDFIKVLVHPEFHSPNKPVGFSEISLEYCKRIRQVARELLKGISESLGLEFCYIERAMNLDSGLQILIANLYPPCPQPELAMGMPPHSDHGLLTLLTQNGICGLQLLHNGKWVNVNAVPNSFLVNTGDHIEILSNGKYKSVVHRAVVNNKMTRVSLAIANGPSLDTVVEPSKELIERQSEAPAYIGIKYKDFLELQQSNQLDNKSVLDRVRV
ncbi:2-oxoglutarate-dependent dioxygenase 19 [Citrus sinensis]|uniref:2-oxoglutarate-dependent dioxygenase 19 n=1 Tax=Citrus sinensis TaxID=2711 RepID=A0ACB8ILM2_CITSI|nr:2-oxoglutarate-dependent dioxygenase 19 [Citrus sinensis]